MKTAIVVVLTLTLSACATLGAPPIAGFGSVLPNGAITHNGTIVSYVGLGEQDAAVGYVIGNYRCGFDANAPREFKVEELGAVLNINDTVSALWSEIPTNVRAFHNENENTILVTGTEGRASAIAAELVARLGVETSDLDDNVDINNLYVLTIVDTGDRVLVHRKRLAGKYAVTALVYEPTSAIAFLSANLLPRAEDDLPAQYRN